MSATQIDAQPATQPAFAGRLRAAVHEDSRSIPAQRSARSWHAAVESSVANPRRTRGLTAPGEAPDFATRLRRAVG